jgi:predicted NBD/HSP70 family sugar kinase
VSQTVLPDFAADAPPRRASVDAVLQFAWDAETFTSSDAMPVVGLTRSTTIDAIDELIERGLVREMANAREGGDYRKGRPARRFSFAADAGAVLGVDAGRAHVVAHVADLAGASLARVTISIAPADDTTEGRRRVIGEAIDQAIDQAGVDRARVVALCAGVPAPVDEGGHSPHDRSGFWDLMNPDLPGLLSGWAPIVRVENDASLTAIAEGSVGAAVGCRSYVALLAGERMGAGIVIDGNLLRGIHGGAGEMAAFDNVSGVGNADGIGARLAAWAIEAIAAGEIGPRHPLATMPASSVTAQAILALARTGDVEARRLIERAGGVVARVAGMFGSLLDPERIVISGAVAAGIEDVLVVARELAPREQALPSPALVASPLGADVVAIGAVSAAVASARAGILDLPPRR